jgi:hypothetical protein
LIEQGPILIIFTGQASTAEEQRYREITESLAPVQLMPAQEAQAFRALTQTHESGFDAPNDVHKFERIYSSFEESCARVNVIPKIKTKPVSSNEHSIVK